MRLYMKRKVKQTTQDISLRIEADVQSEVIDKIEELKTNGITVNEEYAKSVVTIKSEIPLYGYTLSTYKKGKYWYCDAKLSTDSSLSIYYEKLKEVKEGKEGIDLVYSLVDRNSNSVDSFFIRLTPSSFKEYDIFPKTTSFDKLLREGLVVSNDFKVDINTNRGKNDLLFSRGETVKLLLKINKAGYYYIVGHVVKDDEKYSYLLDVNDADGASKFVSFINQDDANKWIEIGEFSVEPPFGVESLQIIASNKDLKNSIPSYNYDSDLGYYFISKDPEKGAMMTRGLKKADSEKNKSLTSEAVLFMTTMDK